MSSKKTKNKSPSTNLSEEEISGVVTKIGNVAEANPEVVERLFENPKIMAVVQKREIFQGPLPHPSHLREYDDIVPGMAERLLALTEKEMGHRHNIQSKALDGAIRKDKRGQWMAFFLSTAIFSLGGFLLWKEQYAVGATLISANVIGLAGVFIVGRLRVKTKQPESDSN